MDILTKEFLILVSSSQTQCLKIRPRLLQSFHCSRQSNWYHSEWCTTYKCSTFFFFIFHVSGKRERERERETPPSLQYYFLFFPSRVYCHVIPHRFLFSHKKLKRVVQKPDGSELPWCLHKE